MATISDILKWEEGFDEGFHGILRRPDGEEGFLSKVGGATSWFKIGKGQDPVEVMKVAKALHDAHTSERAVRPDYLRYLGQRSEDLSKPKE